MRRLALILAIACLAIPVGALALDRALGDGTLSVDGGSGSVSVAVRGAIIGQLDRGSVTIQDPNPNDGKSPVVWGYERKRDLTDTKALFSGTDIRFRVVGGFFRVRIVGTGIDASVVGRGSVTLSPVASLAILGTYSLNGGPDLDFPDFPHTFQLDAGAAG